MSSRKDEIADGFARHFEHFGYKKTSVDEVASELKISKKTIYEHFSTKEEIFYYVVYRVGKQFRRRMEKDLAACVTYREKIERLVRLIFAQTCQWLKEGNDAFEFKYKYNIAELAFKDAYGELVTELVEGGVEAGEFSGVSVAVTVRFIQGIIKEAMDIVVAEPDAPAEDEAVSAIMKLLG
jgi:AcrR family transcriptional regulator